MATGSAEKLVETSLQAARDELVRGLGGLLGQAVPVADAVSDGAVIVGTRASSSAVSQHVPAADLASGRRRGLRRPFGLERQQPLHRHRRQDGDRRPVRDVRLPAAAADAEADHEPEPLRVAQDQEPPPRQLGRHAPLRRQQRGRHRRSERRERDDLQLRRHRRQRRPQPARDPRPLHRGGAGARVGRDQRHRDQPRQRQQRLPDDGVHRAGSGAGRRAAPLRDQDLRWPSTTRRRPTAGSRRTR